MFSLNFDHHNVFPNYVILREVGLNHFDPSNHTW